MLFHEPIAFSIASIITLLIWYLCSVGFLVKSFHTRWLKNFLYVLLEMSIFYVVNILWDSSWEAMLIYFLGYIATTCLIYKNYAGELLSRYRK